MHRTTGQQKFLAQTFLLATCILLCACQGEPTPVGSATEAIQGPQGQIMNQAEKSDATYLIPPEIPPSLVTFIVDAFSRRGEITSLEVLDHGEERWTIQIITERLPDEIASEIHTFIPRGDSWVSQ